MPAGATYEPIATTTLTSSNTNITFSAISSSYTDLRLILFLRSDRSAATVDTIGIQVNSDTSTNYSFTRLRGDGTSATSGNASSSARWDIERVAASSATSNIFSFAKMDIFSYTGSTYKSCLIEFSGDLNSGDTNSTVTRYVGLWRSTSAINSVKIYSTTSSNLVAGTTATLYGIKAA